MVNERRDWTEQQLEAWGCRAQGSGQVGRNLLSSSWGQFPGSARAPVQVLLRVTAYVPARLFLHLPHTAMRLCLLLYRPEFSLFYLSL